jgi:hypothetical protein
MRGIVGEGRRGKETDGCPLTTLMSFFSLPPSFSSVAHASNIMVSFVADVEVCGLATRAVLGGGAFLTWVFTRSPSTQ